MVDKVVFPFQFPDRKWADVELALDPHVTVLTGPNGCGKTLALELMARALGVRLLRATLGCTQKPQIEDLYRIRTGDAMAALDMPLPADVRYLSSFKAEWVCKIQDILFLPADHVVLIDNVDAGLDVARQATFLPLLVQAFPERQFVVTTNSPWVIGSVLKEQVYLISESANEMGDRSWGFNHPPFAQGATAEKIAVDLLGATARPEGPVKDLLTRYVRLVAGQDSDQEAAQLREQLDSQIPGDPLLYHCDLRLAHKRIIAEMDQ